MVIFIAWRIYHKSGYVIGKSGAAINEMRLNLINLK